MKRQKGSVVVKDDISLKIAAKIIENSFVPSSILGLKEVIYAQSKGLGILYNDPLRKETRLFGLIKNIPPHRRVFLGVIWFDNEPRRATPKQWVFEVYGSKYLNLATKLAEKLADTFAVKITVILVSNNPEYERFFYDE